MLAYLALGLSMGFSSGMSPGPLMTLVVTASLRSGLRGGLRVAMAPFVTDLPIVLLSVLLAGRLPEEILRWVGTVGGLVVIGLGFETMRAARHALLPQKEEGAADARRELWRGVVANALNPHPYLFWATVGGPIVIRSWRGSPWFTLAFMVSFYALLVGSKMALAWLVSRKAGALSLTWYRRALAVCGLLLFAMGGLLIWQMWRGGQVRGVTTPQDQDGCTWQERAHLPSGLRSDTIGRGLGCDAPVARPVQASAGSVEERDMSGGTVLLRLAGALALVALNGFFVAVEFAVVAVRRTRIERLVGSGTTAARAALALMNNPDRVIAASQLGITIASLALGWIGEATVAAVIEPPLEALLGRWSEAAAHTIGLVLAFALVTFIHIVLGEQVPKTIAVRYAEGTALTISRPMSWFIRVFRPLIFLLDRATALVLRLLRMEPIGGHQSVYTLDELKLIVRESQESGAIGVQQEEMLQKVFQFRDRQVNEVMVPRPDVIGIEADASVQDLVTLFAESSHARFPVYEDNLDDIAGVLSIKDVLRALAQDADLLRTPVRSLARPALFVPEMARVGDLFSRMRALRTQMAVVIDEYGGTAGIVTLEELVEEIVGQLSDELVAADEMIVHLDPQRAVVNAQLRIDEVNERLAISLPDGEEYETVAGLVLYRLQRVPQVGDLLPCEGLDLIVKEMRGPKIEKVEIRRSG